MVIGMIIALAGMTFAQTGMTIAMTGMTIGIRAFLIPAHLTSTRNLLQTFNQLRSSGKE